MSRHLYLALVLMIAALAAASNARAVPSYDAWFSGAVSTDWNDVNNWEAQQTPDANRTAVIGIMGLYEDVTCVVPSGSIAETGSLEISRYTNGHLIIDPGATLNVPGGGMYVGYSGAGTGTASLTINGALEHTSGSNLSIGGMTNAVVTINDGGSFSTAGWAVIGRSYHMSDEEGYDTTIYHNGGVFTSSFFTSSTAVEVYELPGYTMLYKMSGGTINLTDSGWYNFGGTFEVAGQVYTSFGAGGMRFYSDWDGDVTLKFSGTDPLYTGADGPNFGDPVSRGTVYLDVQDFAPSTLNDWVTVMNTKYALNRDNLVFAPGTDSNVWSMQFVEFNVPDPNDANQQVVDHVEFQIKKTGTAPLLMGDCNRSGYVDDDDLSLLLANWHATTTWDYGNLSDSDTPPGVMGYVDDDDLSLLLANWHAGTPSMGGDSVPEPASVVLLAVGGLGALIRKRR